MFEVSDQEEGGDDREEQTNDVGGDRARFAREYAAVADGQAARKNNCGHEEDALVFRPGGEAGGEAREREESWRVSRVIQAKEDDGCEDEERERDIGVLRRSDCDERGRSQQSQASEHGGQGAAENGKR